MKSFCETCKKENYVILVLVVNCGSWYSDRSYKQFYSHTPIKDFFFHPHFLFPVQYPKNLGGITVLNVGSITVNQITIFIMSHEMLPNRNSFDFFTENRMKIIETQLCKLMKVDTGQGIVICAPFCSVMDVSNL
jgi:hypothetical protein